MLVTLWWWRIQSCHQHILSPTSDINIDLAFIKQFFIDLVEQVIVLVQLNVESLDLKQYPILNGSYWPHLTLL